MPAPTATLQVANPSLGTVSRQPQTTAQQPTQGAPFTRFSSKAQILGPSQAGLAFGSLWTPLLKPVGGYLRRMHLYAAAVGGAGAAAVAAADAPYNVIQALYLRDSFGQPLIQADGYSLYLIGLYGGQLGALGFGTNPATLPSYSAIAATGNFSVRLELPLELDSSGYCSIPAMNAAAQPDLTVQLAPTAQVYGTVPTTVPTLSLTCDEEYWTAPVDNPGLAPPDVGSSAQWSVANASQGVASGAYQRIQLPRVGTRIHTLILVLRDSTGARVNSWPTGDLQLWVDGVPLRFESLNERLDDMYTKFGVTAPTGVIVYTFRDSVQSFVSSADTHDIELPTTPATLLEIGGTFQAIANAPAKVQVVTGELFPVQGIPYTHLGM